MADIVDRVVKAIDPEVARDDCRLMIDAFLAVVRNAPATGDSIQLRGFGTFEVRRRRARQGRNPRTGEPFAIPARYVSVFRPSKHFRGRVERGHGLSVIRGPIEGDGKAQPTPTARQTRIGP